MISRHFGGPSTNLSTEGFFFPTNHYAAFNVDETKVRGIIPAAGVIRNMVVHLDTAPGLGMERHFGFSLNGADKLTDVQIWNSETTGSDTVNSFRVAPGDHLSVTSTYVGAPVNTGANWSWVFDSDVPGESMLMWGTSSLPTTNYRSFVGNRGPRKMNPFQGIDGYVYAEDTIPTWHAATTLSTAGTVSDFYVSLENSPGFGHSRTFTIGGLSVTITEPNTTGSNLGSFGSGAGSTHVCTLDPNYALSYGGPTQGASAMSAKFTATTDGEYNVTGTPLRSETVPDTWYQPPIGHNAYFSTTEFTDINFVGITNTTSIRHFTTLATSGFTPGTGLNSLLRVDGANTTLDNTHVSGGPTTITSPNSYQITGDTARIMSTHATFGAGAPDFWFVGYRYALTFDSGPTRRGPSGGLGSGITYYGAIPEF